jgi:ABC-type lipoprotein export system ATPase subunit
MTDTNGDEILSVRDVRRAYEVGMRKLEVLCGVSLSIQSGEFVALKGASGAGKSTLLHMLGGLDSPDGGEILFRGRSLAGYSSGELNHFRNAHIGFVFQSYHLLPELDALENVCLPARMAREPFGPVAKRAKELLARVGLAERIEHRPTELSGGEQQRVAIARALMNDPALILADEPTGNLDSHTGEEIIQLVTDLRKERNVTLVIATHDSRVAESAPRIVELVDGKIADEAD